MLIYLNSIHFYSLLSLDSVFTSNRLLSNLEFYRITIYLLLRYHVFWRISEINIWNRACLSQTTKWQLIKESISGGAKRQKLELPGSKDVIFAIYYKQDHADSAWYDTLYPSWIILGVILLLHHHPWCSIQTQQSEDTEWSQSWLCSWMCQDADHWLHTCW